MLFKRISIKDMVHCVANTWKGSSQGLLGCDTM